jgi:hypothetical protein
MASVIYTIKQLIDGVVDISDKHQVANISVIYMKIGNGFNRILKGLWEIDS